MTDLVMHQSMVADSRTPNKASKWRATCQINGQEYSVESRSGAPHALARILVDLGVEDQPVTVVSEPVAGENGKMRYIGGRLSYRSLHWMAGHTLVESATQPLHLARYREPDFDFAQAPAGEAAATPEPAPAAPDVLPKTGVKLQRPAA
jgi:hypothetical protein